MSKKKDQAGYVPPNAPKKPPAKPSDTDERGYVPPKLPVKPTQKPTTDKK